MGCLFEQQSHFRSTCRLLGSMFVKGGEDKRLQDTEIQEGFGVRHSFRNGAFSERESQRVKLCREILAAMGSRDALLYARNKRARLLDEPKGICARQLEAFVTGENLAFE
jgi:hypothetical protein